MQEKRRTKVLVVDDDRRMVKTICDILKVKGYDTVEAHTGEEAVGKARSERPDCVLMDVRMPGINGVEALKVMRQVSPELPVVMMSAYSTEELTDEARKNGAYAVLTKPVDVQMILSFLSVLRKEKSILVVDNDPNFCTTIRDILGSRGYKVETEVNPEKVLDDMEQGYKLVVVLDLKLGNTDGLDVMKAVRARYPSKPVVLVTAYGDEMAGSIEKAFRLGAYTCLYKPFEAEDLIKHIEEICLMKRRALLGEPF